MSFFLNVPTIDGTKKETVYNIDDFPYSKIFAPTCRTKKKTYLNCSCAFDIEATTIEPPYTINKKTGKHEYKYTPYSFMYQWQFCICEYVVFGRTWEEFTQFFKKLSIELELSQNKILVCFVHNLAYEFQFMKEFIPIVSMFSKDKRKPMKILTSWGIEFRCSYFLSNMSLSKFCENSKLCTHYKLIDEYNYSIIRTPQTPYFSNDFCENDLAYCYNDVRGLCECIDTLLLEDTIATLPLTNTGYVRRDYRIAMNNEKNRKQFEKTRLDAELYTLLKRAFRGGNTHASRFYANKIIENVYSFDIQSSYPACIMLDYFPMGKFTEADIENQEELEYYIDNYCCLIDCTFYDIIAKIDCVVPYIDIAHCTERSNIINDNGRVLEAHQIRIAITDQDLNIIRRLYNYEGFEIHKFYYSKRGKLPDELRHTMMKFYQAKTQLKGVDGKEYEYMKSKNRLNATFGMCVTDIAHSEVDYNTDTMEWKEEKPDILKALDNFYKSRNSFLSYQWGVYVTANARTRLQRMLDVVGLDIIYIDTDSIKFVDEKHIKEFEELNKQLEQDCLTNDIPAYCDRGKDRFYLGTWDNDGNYLRFKTLGAKKYCFEKQTKNGVKFEITVSGMSKKKGAKAVGKIENFIIGATYNDIGRTTSWYNDSKPHKITINGDTFTTASNIGILETTYTLGVTNEYWELITGAKVPQIID